MVSMRFSMARRYRQLPCAQPLRSVSRKAESSMHWSRLGRLPCAAIVALAVAGAVSAAEFDYPETPKRPVSEEFHGVTVVDDYRWLEDDNAAEVKEWVAAQNALARKYFDGIAQRPDIGRRVQQLLGKRTETRFSVRYRGGRVFALKSAPPKNQPVLVVLPASLDVTQEKVILDPARIDPSGRTTIDFFTPSFDGRLVAVSLSRDGTEDGTAHVYEVATGRRLADAIPRVTYPTGGGSIEWAPDSKGFFYTRYPQPGDRPE